MGGGQEAPQTHVCTWCAFTHGESRVSRLSRSPLRSKQNRTEQSLKGKKVDTMRWWWVLALAVAMAAATPDTDIGGVPIASGDADGSCGTGEADASGGGGGCGCGAVKREEVSETQKNVHLTHSLPCGQFLP